MAIQVAKRNGQLQEIRDKHRDDREKVVYQMRYEEHKFAKAREDREIEKHKAEMEILKLKHKILTAMYEDVNAGDKSRFANFNI